MPSCVHFWHVSLSSGCESESSYSASREFPRLSIQFFSVTVCLFYLGFNSIPLFLFFLSSRNICVTSVFLILSLFVLGVKSSVSHYKSFNPSQFFLLSPYSCISHKHRLIKTIQPPLFKFNSSPGVSALWSGEFCWLTLLQRKKKFFSWPSPCLFFNTGLCKEEGLALFLLLFCLIW